MEGVKGKDNPIHLRLIPEKQDPIRAEKKATLLDAIRTVVEKEKETNPDFVNISTSFLKEAVKRNRKLFLDLSFSAVISYFSNDLNFIRDKIGLPQTTKRIK